MIAMTLAEIASATGGAVHGDPKVLVTGPASQDSREVAQGGLYVALVGERVDGHEYAGRAVAAGAVAVLGSRPTDQPTVVVDDVVHALGLLARHVIDRLPDTTVLALTGSQGKTGTKDYLAQVLATAGETVATAGNLNNEIGVPLTVLRATGSTRFLVVEMGARGVGHIAYLCGIAPPSIAVVVNVGTAHMSEFGSREAIARAKGEILEALPASGTAVINADNDLTARMAPRTRARVLRFGRADSDITWSGLSFDDLDRARFDLRVGQEVAPVALRQVGEHQVHNAAAAAAMAHAAGLSTSDIAAALSDAVSLSRWRMEITELADGGVVINDAYNANPASMRAAVTALGAIGGRRGARTVAVLGEMRELGPGADGEHAAVGRHAAETGVDVLLVVGDAARPMVAGAENITHWHGTAVSVADRELALAWLTRNVRAGDIVLVKASRGPALEVVADGLLAMDVAGAESAESGTQHTIGESQG